MLLSPSSLLLLLFQWCSPLRVLCFKAFSNASLDIFPAFPYPVSRWLHFHFPQPRHSKEVEVLLLRDKKHSQTTTGLLPFSYPLPWYLHPLSCPRVSIFFCISMQICTWSSSVLYSCSCLTDNLIFPTWDYFPFQVPDLWVAENRLNTIATTFSLFITCSLKLFFRILSCAPSSSWLFWVLCGYVLHWSFLLFFHLMWTHILIYTTKFLSSND